MATVLFASLGIPMTVWAVPSVTHEIKIIAPLTLRMIHGYPLGSMQQILALPVHPRGDWVLGFPETDVLK